MNMKGVTDMETFEELPIDHSADKDFLQSLLAEIGTTIGDVDAEVSWFEAREKIINEKIFLNPRIGLGLLLAAHKAVISNRADSHVTFLALGFGTYKKTLAHVLNVLGKKFIQTLYVSVVWNLANRGQNKRSGGITNHPFFDNLERGAGFMIKNKLLETVADDVETWIDTLKAHGKKMSKLRKASTYPPIMGRLAFRL